MSGESPTDSDVSSGSATGACTGQPSTTGGSDAVEPMEVASTDDNITLSVPTVQPNDDNENVPPSNTDQPNYIETSSGDGNCQTVKQPTVLPSDGHRSVETMDTDDRDENSALELLNPGSVDIKEQAGEGKQSQPCSHQPPTPTNPDPNHCEHDEPSQCDPMVNQENVDGNSSEDTEAGNQETQAVPIERQNSNAVVQQSAVDSVVNPSENNAEKPEIKTVNASDMEELQAQVKRLEAELKNVLQSKHKADELLQAQVKTVNELEAENQRLKSQIGSVPSQQECQTNEKEISGYNDRLPNVPKPDSSSLLTEYKEPPKLQNYGNTCYLNAVLQNLNQTLILQHLLKEFHDEMSKNKVICIDTPYPIIKAIRAFFYNVANNADNEPILPIEPIHAMQERSQRFQGQKQQDSHELLRHLMEGVKEEEKYLIQINKSRQSTVTAEDDIVVDPRRILTVADKVFGGHFLTVFHCKKCKEYYHLFEPFLDVSLPVAYDEELLTRMVKAGARYLGPRRTNDSSAPTDQTIDPNARVNEDYKKAVSDARVRIAEEAGRVETQKEKGLKDAFAFYTRKERLDKHMCLHCNQGRSSADYVMSRGSKQTIVYNPPAILTIHFKRFQESSTMEHFMLGNNYTKAGAHIQFDEIFDLAPFCSSHSLRRRVKTKILYSLYGVVVHRGRLDSGHYTACVRVRNTDATMTKAFLQQEFFDRERFSTKDAFIDLVSETPAYVATACMTVEEWSGGRWYEISDEIVKEIDVADVLSKQAYLLFYERIF